MVEFLDALKRQVRGVLLVIRNRLLAHRSSLVRSNVQARSGRIAIEFLSPFAPEWNPANSLWGYWEHYKLTNVCPKEFG